MGWFMQPNRNDLQQLAPLIEGGVLDTRWPLPFSSFCWDVSGTSDVFCLDKETAHLSIVERELIRLCSNLLPLFEHHHSNAIKWIFRIGLYTLVFAMTPELGDSNSTLHQTHCRRGHFLLDRWLVEKRACCAFFAKTVGVRRWLVCYCCYFRLGKATLLPIV